MNRPDFSRSDDYAVLSFNGGSFYYGYEHSMCLECGKRALPGNESCDEHEDAGRDWCFTASIPGKHEMVVIPFSKLGTSDMFDVVNNLNIGIGWILAKYNLVED